MDKNDALFKKSLSQSGIQKRLNYNLQLNVSNGALTCKREVYPLNRLCIKDNFDFQKCTLPNGQQVELNPL